MASLAAVCRASARAASQQLHNQGARRAFHSSQALLAAQNFRMPALSPTMTEGNIASWKVQEGDSFSAGDVLLEIETDKAQMDVEAQDDGILAKITVQDGSKAVQVGTRIAVTAEPGDDLSTLEIPAEESPAPKKEAEAPKESKKEPAPIPKEERTSAPSAKSDASKKASSGKASKQTYPLYPSVQHLLEVNGLPKEEADKIPATGPGGRLLKGDVLAYVGQIENSYPSWLASRFTKLSHLELSNIKPMPKKEAPKKAAAKAPAVVEDLPINISLPVSLTAVKACQKSVKESTGVYLPLSTFVERATKFANEDLPRSNVPKLTADELFDAVLGLDTVSSKHSRGEFRPEVTTLPPTTTIRSKVAKPTADELFDAILGLDKKTSAKKTVSGATGVAGPVKFFSLIVYESNKKRGRDFLKRVKTVLEAEPWRLVHEADSGGLVV